VKQLKVILADDNDTFREALKNVLVKKFDAEIVAEASNGPNSGILGICGTPILSSWIS